MKQNVGNIDRVLRIVGGAALIILAAMGTIGWWGYIGIVPIFTGLTRWCPVYIPLGLNTGAPDKDESKGTA